MALTDSLKAYYKFDESSGNASDSSGSGYTLTNNNTITYTTGKINNCADTGSSNTNKYFSGSNWLSYSEVGSGWSFDFWINPASVSSRFVTHNMLVLNSGTGTSKRAFSIQHTNTAGQGLGVWMIGNTLVDYWSGTILSTSTWTHCAVTFDGTTLTIYINGSSVYSSAFSFTDRGDTAGVGTSTVFGEQGANSLLSGKMDAGGIWARALTSGEVSQLYNGGAGLQYPFTTPVNSNFLAFM